MNSLIPSVGEKRALSGTSGRPSARNAFVTTIDPRNSDTRTPKSHANTHASGGADAFDAIPAYPRTLVRSQTIPDTWFASLVGPITIPTGVTLTFTGTGYLRITE